MDSDVTYIHLYELGSVECTFLDFLVRLFRNDVYVHFIFPKIYKRGDWKVRIKLRGEIGIFFKN